MNAIQYFEQYKTRLMSSDEKESYSAIEEIFLKFSDEVREIAKKRHVMLDKSFLAIINEQNQKWNALCRLLEREYQVSVLKKDGFKEFWLKKLSE